MAGPTPSTNVDAGIRRDGGAEASRLEEDQPHGGWNPARHPPKSVDRIGHAAGRADARRSTTGDRAASRIRQLAQVAHIEARDDAGTSVSQFESAADAIVTGTDTE